MIIKYNIEDKSYYLCDLGDGSGTFVRLDIPIVSTDLIRITLKLLDEPQVLL